MQQARARLLDYLPILVGDGHELPYGRDVFVDVGIPRVDHVTRQARALTHRAGSTATGAGRSSAGADVDATSDAALGWVFDHRPGTARRVLRRFRLARVGHSHG